MFKSILIPTDFSPSAWNAVQVGLSLAMEYKAKVSVLHIYPMNGKSSVLDREQSNKILSKVKENMEKFTNELTAESDVAVENVVVSGNIKKRLHDFVNSHDFDLVVMGLNGGGTDDTIGSHLSNVISSRKRPVLVVPSLLAD